MKNTLSIAVLITLCAAASVAAAEPVCEAPEPTSAGDGVLVSDDGRVLRLLISDRGGFAGRVRKEAYFVRSTENELTLVGVVRTTYSDLDGDRALDAGEVIATAMIPVEQEPASAVADARTERPRSHGRRGSRTVSREDQRILAAAAAGFDRAWSNPARRGNRNGPPGTSPLD